jgi:hypothetical protein
VLPPAGANRGIGTPEDLRQHLAAFEASGVDQVAFIQQGGRNRHEHICQSLELFAAEVMPEFKEREAARQRAKAEALAPYVEQAMARKRVMPALANSEIPSFVALGRQIAEQGKETEQQRRNRAKWSATSQVPLSDPLKGKAPAAE